MKSLLLTLSLTYLIFGQTSFAKDKLECTPKENQVLLIGQVQEAMNKISTVIAEIFSKDSSISVQDFLTRMTQEFLQIYSASSAVTPILGEQRPAREIDEALLANFSKNGKDRIVLITENSPMPAPTPKFDDVPTPQYEFNYSNFGARKIE